ncbi:MCP methyltransferase, CheR-type (plasmid) [Nitrobacter hamburgensis X14]|uniref:histidine kinase n=1 Tax=Nitrobacter hamburgensis (strain DSM 10229 / NCIMB 13809 / X14) TaxID=323097 RepID=Q1QF26_NITHX|nr:chemotaxis protein CheB [Nitrobacter hamburgensis]ABE65171.1 MCP methyltransferase, CheR-type [Nitrobacter hamburgensis X14]
MLPQELHGEKVEGKQPTPDQSGVIATKRRPPSLVVGIGASAGGLDAFKSFFEGVPADTGMSFVLVQHLDPNHKSLLVELLRPHTSMRVEEARDGVALAANHIFVIPPNATMTMEGDLLRVSTPAPAREYRRPIDTFFTSLAENQQECAVAVVLSGVGSDGTLGVKAIKENGGYTFAQAEFNETAMSGMPRSAVATGLVDCVAPVKNLPAKRLEHQAHLTKVEEQKDSEGVRDDVRESLTTITSLLRKRLKHDFSGYKQNTIIRRVQRRMQVLQIEAVPAYVERLRREPPEADALFRELLIGVTQFFRDESAFEALKTAILPSLLAAKQPDDTIRVWVAGCATGEEVYSIAIVLKEAMAELNVEPSVTIFGTDIDGKAVAFARAARYRKTDGVSPERLGRWFVREREHYCPVATIREMCVFSQHSIIKDPPFSKLDLVSCRNVLIYMDNEFQHRVMQTFHYGLNPGGYLFLGPSESVSREIKLFTIIDKKHRILQRQDGVRATLPVVQTASSLRAVEPTWSAEVHAEDGIDQSARRAMDKYAPAYFVIDRHCEVLRFSGAETGRYLEPSPGTATLNLFGILAKALRSQVRNAVDTSFATHQTVVDETVAATIDGRWYSVQLIVEPIVEIARSPAFFIVAFRERGPLTNGGEAGKTAPAVSDLDAASHQQELRSWQARYKAASNELETHIENMKSVTEEYQSVNEELQSSNEELETAKEEMQSVNEELQTVNSEMQSKNDQLNGVNNDLQNLLDSTQIATIFLDDNLHIKNFTPAAMELFALHDCDRGRAITDIVTLLAYDKLREDVRKVQRTLAVVEQELDLKDESATFIMRIRPYRTVKNVITGVVITFTDITERKAQDDQLRVLMKELQHRTNNLFRVIQAMARQTAKHSANFADFEVQFGARIQGLSESNTLLIGQNWQSVSLERLVRTQLAPFIGTDQARLEIDGLAVFVATEAVQTLGLALHELATNASKYGALSVPGGRILLQWKFTGGDKIPEGFRLEWRERGGPTVKPAKRRGFGRFVIDQMVTSSLHATVGIDLAPEGFRWTLDMPASQVQRAMPDKEGMKNGESGSAPLFDVGIKKPEQSDYL